MLIFTSLDSLATSIAGTFIYFAPERFTGTNSESDLTRKNYGYGAQNDVWSLGISLCEVVYGAHPFAHMTSAECLREIPKVVGSEVVERCFSNNYSENAKNFAATCLQNIENRPKFYGLKKVEFYKQHKMIESSKKVAAFLENCRQYLKEFL